MRSGHWICLWLFVCLLFVVAYLMFWRFASGWCFGWWVGGCFVTVVYCFIAWCSGVMLLIVLRLARY